MGISLTTRHGQLQLAQRATIQNGPQHSAASRGQDEVNGTCPLPLFDDLVCTGEQRRWLRETSRLYLSVASMTYSIKLRAKCPANDPKRTFSLRIKVSSSR